MPYTIAREIGIDAGHRVPTHGSKCKNLHGHRYRIMAICESGRLHETGEQKDMALDFGFLKEEMMEVIDKDCDHGLILWRLDPILNLLGPRDDKGWEFVDTAIETSGYCIERHTYAGFGKLYIIPEIPTAEVLAKHWFGRLKRRVSTRSSRLARLVGVKVWETPNCWASYTEDTQWPAREPVPEGR